MKVLHVFLAVLLCISQPQAEALVCSVAPPDMSKSWIDMVEPCKQVLESQVNIEIGAAMNYLAMGVHFARDDQNRPGFSKFFFDSANEERQHAIKIIEYLLMRDQLTSNVSSLIKYPVVPARGEWATGFDALQYALELETNVTKSIRNIIIKCEKPDSGTDFNDYHLVDYFTGEFLEEQYKGQRDLAGKLSVLGKMTAAHGQFGEFLFDKKLLNGEV